jgi:hypothetical protein
MQWFIGATGYSQSGDTDLNSSTFVTLRDDAPSGATVGISIVDSFVFNSKTWNLQSVSSTSGTIIDFGIGQYDIEDISANTDITFEYT